MTRPPTATSLSDFSGAPQRSRHPELLWAVVSTLRYAIGDLAALSRAAVVGRGPLLVDLQTGLAGRAVEFDIANFLDALSHCSFR